MQKIISLVCIVTTPYIITSEHNINLTEPYFESSTLYTKNQTPVTLTINDRSNSFFDSTYYKAIAGFYTLNAAAIGGSISAVSFIVGNSMNNPVAYTTGVITTTVTVTSIVLAWTVPPLVNYCCTKLKRKDASYL